MIIHLKKNVSAAQAAVLASENKAFHISKNQEILITGSGVKELPAGLADFTDNLSPVVSDITLRISLIFWLVCKLNIDQMDVETAFLEGFLSPNEYIYMKCPEGMTLKYDECIEIRKGMYGLVQSARILWKRISNYLCSEKMGFVKGNNGIYSIPNQKLQLGGDWFVVKPAPNSKQQGQEKMFTIIGSNDKTNKILTDLEAEEYNYDRVYESKLRSVIAKLIKEELNEDESESPVQKGDILYHKNSDSTLEVVEVSPTNIKMKVTKISDKTPSYIKVGQSSKTNPSAIGKTYTKK